MSHYYTTLTKPYDTFEATHGIKNNNTLIVLRALFFGIPVELGEHTYRLFECTHGGFKAAVVTDGNKFLCGVDMGLESFSKLAENVHPEQIAKIIKQCEELVDVNNYDNVSVNAPK